MVKVPLSKKGLTPMPAGGAFLVMLALVIFLLPASAYAAGRDVEAITAALDHAHTQAEIAKQASGLEALVGQSTLPPRAAVTQLARAYYLMGEAEKDKAKRKKYLDSALDASAKALKAEPDDAVALYWRSMALLLKAEIAGGLSALGMVKEAMRGFEAVEAKAPSYDSAGAYRSHGKVLIDAPAWAFIGDKKKGLRLILKARELDPACLITRLYLAQAYERNGMPEKARAEIGYILGVPPGEDPAGDRDIQEEARKLMKKL